MIRAITEQPARTLVRHDVVDFRRAFAHAMLGAFATERFFQQLQLSQVAPFGCAVQPTPLVAVLVGAGAAVGFVFVAKAIAG